MFVARRQVALALHYVDVYVRFVSMTVGRDAQTLGQR